MIATSGLIVHMNVNIITDNVNDNVNNVFKSNFKSRFIIITDSK